MLYVTCCRTYILGQVETIIGLSWEGIGATLEQSWAMKGQSLGYFGRAWGLITWAHIGFHLRIYASEMESAYLVEMPKSLSTYARVAKTLA